MNPIKSLFGQLIGAVLALLLGTDYVNAATYIVTNTNANGPGSFYQAMVNANANPGADIIRFNIPANLLGADNVARINLGGQINVLGPVTIDGSSQAIFTGLSNTACLNNESVTVGVDKVPIPAINCPEVEITFPNSATVGFSVSTGAAGTVFNNLAVVGAAAGHTFIIQPGIPNITITDCFINVLATGQYPGSARSSVRAIASFGAGTKITHNLLGFNQTTDAIILRGAGNGIVRQNKILQAGLASTIGDGVTIFEASSNTVEENYIFKPGANGIHILKASSNNIIRNNTIVGAGQLSTETGGITVNRYDGTAPSNNNQIRKNVITASGGPGILIAGVGNSGTGNLISQNSTFGNATLGIDLSNENTAASRDQGNGVTINNGATNAGLGNIGYDFPIINNAEINSNGDLVVTGFTRPGAVVELFGADNTAHGTGLTLKYGEGEHYFYSFKEGTASIDLDATTGSYTVGDGNTDANASRFRVIIPRSQVPEFVNNELRLTATATDGSNNTSEFGPVYTLTLTIDYGDLPTIYCTQQSANGASHIITAGLKMGANIDADVDGTPAAAGANPLGDDTNGDGFIRYEYYNGSTGSTASIPTSGATATGLVSGFSNVPANQGDPSLYGLRFKGYIIIKEAGTYTFYTHSDDGSVLKINGTTVVNNDFAQTPTERSGTITLTAGVHEIEVLYWQGDDFSSTLSVLYEGPGVPKQVIPSSALSSINPDDEDGVAAFPVLSTSTAVYTVPVVVQNTTGAAATLIAWIDFNRNGTFEPGEASAITSVPAGTNGSVNVTWNGLSGLSEGLVYARFRLSSDPGLTTAASCGALNNGEVEDYQLLIGCTPATITASQNNLTICSGEQVNVTFTTNPLNSPVRWTGSDGTAGFSATLLTAPANEGTTPLLVSYTATAGEFGCTSFTIVTVTVNPVPIVTPSQCSQTICSGEAGNITFVSSIPGSTIHWLRVEDNLAGTGDISEVMNTAGNFTYKIWATSPAPASCPSSTTITCEVVVNDCCSLLATANSNSPQCTGSELQLNAFTSGGSQNFSYSWTGPNGFVSNLSNPTIPNATTAASGSYTLVVTDLTLDDCSVLVTTPVTIATQPNLAVTGGTPLTICSGQSTTLSIGGSNGANVTWTGTNGQTGTGVAIPTGTLVNYGTQPYTLAYRIFADAGNCSDSLLVLVTVNPEPRLQIKPVSAVYCDIEQVNITATAFPSNSTVDWTRTPNTPNPPVDSGTGNGSVNIIQQLPAASYTYSFTATNPTTGCSSQPVTIPITVQQ